VGALSFHRQGYLWRLKIGTLIRGELAIGRRSSRHKRCIRSIHMRIAPYWEASAENDRHTKSTVIFGQLVVYHPFDAGSKQRNAYQIEDLRLLASAVSRCHFFLSSVFRDKRADAILAGSIVFVIEYKIAAAAPVPLHSNTRTPVSSSGRYPARDSGLRSGISVAFGTSSRTSTPSRAAAVNTMSALARR